jgi:hypothetical protein
MEPNLRILPLALAVLCGLGSTSAIATPGLGGEVYGATVDKGELEFEAIYGRLSGGTGDGEEVLKIESSYAVSDRLLFGLVGEFEKKPGQPRRAEELAVEAIYHLGKTGGIDFALYGEYAFGLHGPDKFETKLLMQHRSGPWDLRLNLIAEKRLQSGEPLEFSYAASVDRKVAGAFHLGVEAFGELGSTDKLLPRAEHFIGPITKVDIEGLGPELCLKAGYLFALGKARDNSQGQFRLALELEF